MINIFNQDKNIPIFFGISFIVHSIVSMYLGVLKGWGGDEWFSYNDFTIMALPFSIITKIQIAILGPLTQSNFIYYKMQGLVWILGLFIFLYYKYKITKNKKLKKYILFAVLFISINPFIIGQTHFFRYYNLYLFGAFVTFFLIEKKGENFILNRKIFYSALIISPFIHFFICWQLFIYILLKELETIFKKGQKIKGIILISFGVFFVLNIDFFLVNIWNLLMHNYDYLSLDLIQHRGFSYGSLIKPFNAIFVYLYGRDIIPLEYYSITVIYFLVGLSLIYIVTKSIKYNSTTTINLFFSGIIPFIGIYILLDPLTLPGMTQADAHHGIFFIPWILYLLLKLNKYLLGRILNIVLFSSFIYADYLTVSKDFPNWRTVEEIINSNSVTIISDNPGDPGLNLENNSIIWFKDTEKIIHSLQNKDTISILMQGWSNYQALTIEQKWNSAKGTVEAFNSLEKLLLNINNEGFKLKDAYSNFPLHCMVFIKNEKITTQPLPWIYDLKYRDLKIPLEIDNQKVIGFSKIEYGDSIFIDSSFYYFIQTTNPVMDRTVVRIINGDGTKMDYNMDTENDTYRSYFCRSINEDEIVYTYKKRPLVSNSMRYPGSIFNSEGRIFKFTDQGKGVSIMPLNRKITLFIALLDKEN
jgi:hypothetical protein